MLEALSDSSYAEWVRESLWGWPMALTVHAFGNGAVIGLSFIIALRLLGFFRTIPYTSLNRLFPVIWIAVVFQVLSGASLWMTKPDKYLSAGMFDAKFSFVVLGVIVTAIFQSKLRREAGAWELSGKVSPSAVKLSVAAAFVWAAVLTTGRLTAYLGQLYS
jgi:hypothetical protein